MNIVGSILDKIFGKQHPHGQAAPAQAPAQAQQPHAQPAPAQPAPAQHAPATPAQPAAPAQPVDVEAVLSQMAASHGGGGNWRTSIVDLLKLLDLDSSLAARKQLAQELNVHAGPDGSAEENIALHKAVMRKLAENGGKVPADLRD